MSSPLRSSSEKVVDFVPSGYIAYVGENRINVREATKEKIQNFMKTANIYQQEVILQDLLLAGRKMKTEEERNMVVLAAELFILVAEDVQRDFLKCLINHTWDFKNFVAAMQINALFHQSNNSSNFTGNQLSHERALAKVLKGYVNWD